MVACLVLKIIYSDGADWTAEELIVARNVNNRKRTGKKYIGGNG